MSRAGTFPLILPTRLLLLAAWLCLHHTVDAADLLLSGVQQPDVGGADYYIISIGVNTYRDPFWPALQWPASDAGKVAAHLGRDTTAPIHKYLLVDEQASFSNINRVLNEVAGMAHADDTVIFYVSSHGTLAPGSNGELQPVTVVHDTQSEQLLTTGLSHRSLQQWLDQLPARRKLLIFATCHSGEGKSQLPPEVKRLINSRKGRLAPLADASEGTLILAAAAQGEAAHEDD